MAITFTALGLISGNSLRTIADVDADETAENNINDGAATLYSIEIDNTANASVSYIKLYDAFTPTVGTTVPKMILPMTASAKKTYIFPSGVTFSTALSVAGLTAGGTAGTTGPTSNVLISLVVA